MPRPGLRPEEVAPSGQQFFLRRVGVPADRKWQASRLPAEASAQAGSFSAGGGCHPGTGH